MHASKPPAVVQHLYNAPALSVLEAITFALQRVVEANAKVHVLAGSTPFSFAWPGDWQPVHEYATTLFHKLGCGLEVFVAAMALLSRLERSSCLPALTQVTVHRAFLACVVLALKVYQDCPPPFADLASAGKVKPQELKTLELRCFEALDFECVVSEAEFTDWRLTLQGFDTLRRRGVRSLGQLVPPVSLAALNVRMVETLHPPPRRVSRARRFSFRKSLPGLPLPMHTLLSPRAAQSARKARSPNSEDGVFRFALHRPRSQPTAVVFLLED